MYNFKKMTILIIILILYKNTYPVNNMDTTKEKKSHNKFDNWLFVASFDKDNVPTFKFIQNTEEKYWVINDKNKNEYIYDGYNTKAGFFNIYNMKYYNYRGYNPLYTKNQNNNDKEMIKRFYFYRFTGKGAGFINLDNSLIAIDTHSKYVYIYGFPIKEKIIFGVDVPLEWGASDTNTQKTFMPFYKYDPIGFVNDDGSITLYEWYQKSFLDKQKRYKPIYNNKSIYK